MPFITVQGSKVYYELEGSGSPLALVMGLGGGVQVWSPQRPKWAKHHQVISYDMRGIGRSDRPQQRLEMDDVIEEFKELLEQLELSSVHALGYSYGGIVLQRCAARYPHLLRSITLLSSGFEGTPFLRAFVQMQIQLAEQLDRVNYLKQLFLWILSPSYFEQYPDFFNRITMLLGISSSTIKPSEVFEQYRDSFQESLIDALKKIECPIQIIHGIYDRVVPPEEIKRALPLIPNAEVTWINGGHMLNWEKPTEITDAVISFLAKCDKC